MRAVVFRRNGGPEVLEHTDVPESVGRYIVAVGRKTRELPGVERKWRSRQLRERAKLVDPVAVIGVVVGDDDTVDVTYAGGEQLGSEVGAAVDENRFAADFGEEGAAQAAVPGLGWIALAPVVADPGNAARRSGPEERQRVAHAAVPPATPRGTLE